MTRRDYILIAKTIAGCEARNAPTSELALGAEGMRILIAKMLSVDLSRQNTNFDTNRFLRACGVEQ